MVRELRCLLFLRAVLLLSTAHFAQSFQTLSVEIEELF